MDIITIERLPSTPWKEERVCICGSRFPFPATTKAIRSNWSHHLNGCKQFKSAHAAEERRRQEEAVERDYSCKHDDLVTGGFTAEQATTLIEVFGL
jgi:hypothetical protein